MTFLVQYWKFALIWVLSVALVWAVPAELRQRQEAARYKGLYEAEREQLEAAQARTARIQKQVLTATADAAKARQSLKEALDAIPEVRDASTPEPVRVSLCATLRCK